MATPIFYWQCQEMAMKILRIKATQVPVSMIMLPSIAQKTTTIWFLTKNLLLTHLTRVFIYNSAPLRRFQTQKVFRFTSTCSTSSTRQHGTSTSSFERERVLFSQNKINRRYQRFERTSKKIQRVFGLCESNALAGSISNRPFDTPL